MELSRKRGDFPQMFFQVQQMLKKRFLTADEVVTLHIMKSLKLVISLNSSRSKTVVTCNIGPIYVPSDYQISF